MLHSAEMSACRSCRVKLEPTLDIIRLMAARTPSRSLDLSGPRVVVLSAWPAGTGSADSVSTALLTVTAVCLDAELNVSVESVVVDVATLDVEAVATTYSLFTVAPVVLSCNLASSSAEVCERLAGGPVETTVVPIDTVCHALELRLPSETSVEGLPSIATLALCVLDAQHKRRSRSIQAQVVNRMSPKVPDSISRLEAGARARTCVKTAPIGALDRAPATHARKNERRYSVVSHEANRVPRKSNQVARNSENSRQRGRRALA